MNQKDIRWKQRYQNLFKAFKQLEKGISINNPNEIEIQGVIQSFEFTFELIWKTLKDYLESKDIKTSYPREVLKQSFKYELFINGEIWMDMLEKRNLMSHTYDQNIAEKAYNLIRNTYFIEIKSLIDNLNGKLSDE